MPTLILLRHGQSQWNLEDRFTGWVDVDLTPQGEAEAKKGGELIAAAGIAIDRCFTSVQTRAIRTSWLARQAAGQAFVPEVKDWRLNERHYGGLTGLNKTETAAKHGADQVKVWRRSYDIPPQPLGLGLQHPAADRDRLFSAHWFGATAWFWMLRTASRAWSIWRWAASVSRFMAACICGLRWVGA